MVIVNFLLLNIDQVRLQKVIDGGGIYMVTVNKIIFFPINNFLAATSNDHALEKPAIARVGLKIINELSLYLSYLEPTL